MDVKQVKTAEIKVYKKNAKKHSDNQVAAIANSIRKFGFRQPLVLDRNMEIIIGHGRFEAAKLLKMQEVPCVMADDLTEEQVKALRIADNKTNESEWDFDILGEELGDILNFDMTDFGFSERDILELTIDDSPEEIPVYPSTDSKDVLSKNNAEYAPQDEFPRTIPVLPSSGVTREEFEEYESRAEQLVTRRVIIVFRTDEEEAFVKNLLGVPAEEALNVIYLAEKMMKPSVPDSENE